MVPLYVAPGEQSLGKCAVFACEGKTEISREIYSNFGERMDTHAHVLIFIYSIIPVTRTPDNSNSPYLELKLYPLALILLHNLPPITRTFVSSNHFHRSIGGSSYREYTVNLTLSTGSLHSPPPPPHPLLSENAAHSFVSYNMTPLFNFFIFSSHL